MQNPYFFERRARSGVSLLLAGFVAVLVCESPTRAGQVLDPAAAFFEQQVRPVLAERCYSCHSAGARKIKAGLRLDTRQGLLQGGKNGPAIRPGEPDKSLLITAIRYTDKDLQMPPKGPLAKAQIAALEYWVKIGAPDPREADAPPVADAGRHWALDPVRPAPPPAVRDEAWPANEIDRFVLSKLEGAGLRPSPPAGKLELLRRVTVDLTGLPPTPDEVNAFLSDASPDAYPNVVDRLLASPRYGERWGRHWLDVVRFGESHGYEQNHLRDRAWPYRDYVIGAFNQDLPYGRFVEEQLAGDALGGGAGAATGFLVAGVHDTVGNGAEAARRQQRADDLDDIVSTVGATFMGLTVGCAKCHDHKFDPIPQADYYALAAVFAGVRHEERPLAFEATPGPKRELAELAEHIRGVTAELARIERSVREARPRGAAPARPAANARRNVEDFAPVAARYVRFTVLATRDGSEPCLDELEVYGPGGGPNLALSSAGGKASASSVLPGHAIHRIAHLNDGLYGNEHSWISNEKGGGWAQIELPGEAMVGRIVWGRHNRDDNAYQDRLASRYQVAVSLDAKSWTPVAGGDDRATESIDAGLTPEQRRRRDELRAELKALQARAAAFDAPKAYVGRFTAPDPVYLLKRGDVMQRGDRVGPAALSRVPGLAGDLNLAADAPEPARRLALARWIRDPRNPLPARVLVNRVWQYHFGRGLVSTPSDLGANGEPPSHPQLLDWLAADFVKGGWTLKRMHRQIVLSRAYQQTSRTEGAALEAGLKADGGDRLLWRMPLRRLEAEAVRDSILSASGKLDLSPAAVGGPGFRLFDYRVVNIALYGPLAEQGPATWRRAVYQQTARNIHDDLMAAFDEPENAQRAPRREVTTTPLQALTLLNAPFVLRQSEFFAGRVRSEAGAEAARQAERAFRVALGRPPTPAEGQAAVELARRRGLAALCRALFNSNEFLTY